MFGQGTEERAVVHEDRVCSLMFHPELGHIVASGAINGKIRIVNTMGGSAECIARGEEMVTSATWNTTGDALAVGCDGGTLRVFRALDLREVKKALNALHWKPGRFCYCTAWSLKHFG